jgi:hypothetical protein
MGHATLALTLARSKAGSERLPLSPEEGAYTPHRPFSGVRHAPSPRLSDSRPRSSGGLTDLELVSSPANNGLGRGRGLLSPPQWRWPAAEAERRAPARTNHRPASPSVSSPVGLTVPKRFGGRAGARSRYRAGVELLQVTGVSCFREPRGLTSDGRRQNALGRRGVRSWGRSAHDGRTAGMTSEAVDRRRRRLRPSGHSADDQPESGQRHPFGSAEGVG